MEINALFHARQVGTTGHEIVNPAGQVVGWTVDASWAAVIVALLNQTDHGGAQRLRAPDHDLKRPGSAMEYGVVGASLSGPRTTVRPG